MRGSAEGPTLCLLGHVDTVLADAAEWSVDPWSGELRDGCVWGRGAVDMKGQVAAEATAALSLAGEGWRPEAGELLLAFTCDEETGAVSGAQWLCSEHSERVRADLVVNEGAGQRMEHDGRRVYGVCVAEKGVFRFKLSVRGRAGHASVPRIGDNALTRMGALLTALGERRPAPAPGPEVRLLFGALGLDGDDVEGALAALEHDQPELAVLLEPLTGISLAPTLARGGEKINVIPSHAELEVDCRVPPGLGEEHVRAAIESVLGENGYELELLDRIVGNRSPAETPLMDAMSRFIEREDPGAAVAPMPMSGFSDSHWWREAFPECVVYGFFPQREMGFAEGFPLMHGVDERIPVADLGFAASFYSDLIVETLS